MVLPNVHKNAVAKPRRRQGPAGGGGGGGGGSGGSNSRGRRAGAQQQQRCLPRILPFLLLTFWISAYVSMFFLTQELPTSYREDNEAAAAGGGARNIEKNNNLRCEQRHQIHSHKWLHGQRLSNNQQQFLVRQLKLADIYMDTNLVPHFAQLSEQTLCIEQGSFRSTDPLFPNNNNNNNNILEDEQRIDQWYIKLLFLAIHDFFHAPARKEYLARRQLCDTSTQNNDNDNDDSSSPQQAQHNLPPYEYECAEAQFLVAPIPGQGIGASFRLGAIGHMIVSIASGRIPLFLSNTPKGTPRWMQAPWPLVSCPRGDYQCVFQPLSPCTLLEEEVMNATRIPESEARQIRKTGSIPEQYASQRVLIMEGRVGGVKAKITQQNGPNPALRQELYQRAKRLVETWEASLTIGSNNNNNDHQIHILHEALKRIQQTDPEDSHDHFGYTYRHYRIPHVLLMYLMRPNAAAKPSIQSMVQKSIPSDFFETSQKTTLVLGMPIRGKFILNGCFDSNDL
jgi:hypothetical protein